MRFGRLKRLYVANSNKEQVSIYCFSGKLNPLVSSMVPVFPTTKIYHAVYRQPRDLPMLMEHGCYMVLSERNTLWETELCKILQLVLAM